MIRFIYLVGLLMLLTGCGTSPKTSFYVLNGGGHDFDSNATNDTKGRVIAVWPVVMPDVLDRSEIVTRPSQYQIDLADFDWWAGDLGQNMTRLLGNDLVTRLKSDNIVAATGWGARLKKDYQIKVRVERFDGELGGEVVFRGFWVLLDGNGSKELIRKVFKYETTATDKTYTAMVAALSQLTLKLSDEIATALTGYKAK
jgi:uncharacterized lipoprotein YmbA